MATRETSRAARDGWLPAETATRLVRRAQRGTPTDLDGLLSAIRPAFFAYFSRQVDAPAADDLAQRALLIVAREYLRISPDGAGRWLVTMARNVVRDEYRRRHRVAARLAPAYHAVALAAPDVTPALAEYHELARAVLVAARVSCSAALRRVVLGVLRGLEVADIARLEGVSVCAVRVRLARARAVLRDELRSFRDDGTTTNDRTAAPRASTDACGRPRRARRQGPAR